MEVNKGWGQREPRGTRRRVRRAQELKGEGPEGTWGADCPHSTSTL